MYLHLVFLHGVLLHPLSLSSFHCASKSQPDTRSRKRFAAHSVAGGYAICIIIQSSVFAQYFFLCFLRFTHRSYLCIFTLICVCTLRVTYKRLPHFSSSLFKPLLLTQLLFSTNSLSSQLHDSTTHKYMKHITTPANTDLN